MHHAASLLAEALAIAPHHSALIPFLDPENIIKMFGPWGIVIVAVIVFAETGLLVGFILPGDTLLLVSGLLTFTGTMTEDGVGIHLPIWLVCLIISFAAWLGGEVGYFIGRKAGPSIFERRESGLFSKANVVRTNEFFERFGPVAVILARFVPIVRTFAPIAAGVGHMNPRRYSLYNLIGAVLWGSGFTFAGFLLGYFPPIAKFVTHYIDIILIGAILVAVVPSLIHLLRGRAQAKRINAEQDAAAGDAAS